MAKGSMRVDTREFDQTIRRYREVSKRDVVTIVNTKAFFIARRAVIETPKTDKSKITALFRDGSGWRSGLSGGTGAIVGRIINKRRGDRGEKGLYGRAMAEAVAMMKAARLRSVAFLKSGWLPAIKTLAGLAEKRGAPRQDRSAKQYGAVKGRAQPATAGWFPKAVIDNLASARHETREALVRYGGPALQRAFDFETRSMLDYIERKLKAGAKACGIKTH
jgi:hypothetical protein